MTGVLQKCAPDSILCHTYYLCITNKAHWFSCTWWGASMRHNRIARRTYGMDGSLLRDELLVENHALTLYDPYLEEGLKKAE